MNHFWIFTIVIGGLIAALIALKVWQGEPVIRVERSTGQPRMNRAGAAILLNECPVCAQTNFNFYYGKVTPEFRVVYCGSPTCRASLRVENYGSDRIYVEPHDEEAPPYLYS